MQTQEIWKDIKTHEGLYQVSNQGRVRSLDAYNICRSRSGNEFVRLRKGRVLKFQLHNGYLWTVICNRKPTTISAHRAVALAFIPNPENKPEVNHKDGNKQNNNDWNLEWCTPMENTQHAIRTGLIGKKYNKRGSKINETIVREIRDKILNEEYMSDRAIGEIYGLSHSGINGIRRGLTWKHVK